MNILFLITITDSFGEREHALSFARQIHGSNFRPLFFLNPQLRPFFSYFPFNCYYSEKLTDLQILIAKEKPKLIICCEYYHLFDSFRAYLDSLDIPVATMDGTTIGEEINSDPLQLGTGKKNILPEQVIRLRPCPVNDTQENTSNVKYWNLFPKVRKEEDKVFLKNFFSGNYEKYLFMAISPWAVKAASVIGMGHYYSFIFELLSNILEKSGFRVNLTVTSLFKPQIIRQNNLTIHFLNYMDYRLYEKLLLNSDLVISDNIIQTSLSKAFMAGINTLALINSSPQNQLNLHSFNIFPLKVFFPEKRQYYQAVEKADIFSTVEVEMKINKLLQAVNENNDYRKKVNLLTTPEKIVQDII